MGASPGPVLVAIAAAGPFLTLTAIVMVGPLLVEMARDLAVSPAAAGQLVTATVLAWGISAPVVGQLSDRYGRRPMLLAGLALLAGSTLGGAGVPGYGGLFALRLVAGLGAALVAPNCVALVADHVAPERRGRLLALTTMGVPLSSLLGLPLVTLVAARHGWRGAFVTAGLLFVLLGLAVVAVVPGGRARPATASGGFGVALRMARRAWAAVAVAFLDRLSVTAVMTYLAGSFMAVYGIGLAQVASVLAVVAVGMLAGQLAGGFVAERRDRLAWSAAALVAAGLAALPLFTWHPGLWSSTALAVAYGTVNAVSRTPFVTMVTELDPDARATLIGFWSLANQLGATAGAALGGLLVALAGFPAIGWLCLVAGLGAGLWVALLVREPGASYGGSRGEPSPASSKEGFQATSQRYPSGSAKYPE